MYSSFYLLLFYITQNGSCSFNDLYKIKSSYVKVVFVDEIDMLQEVCTHVLLKCNFTSFANQSVLQIRFAWEGEWTDFTFQILLPVRKLLQSAKRLDYFMGFLCATFLFSSSRLYSHSSSCPVVIDQMMTPTHPTTRYKQLSLERKLDLKGRIIIYLRSPKFFYYWAILSLFRVLPMTTT